MPSSFQDYLAIGLKESNEIILKSYFKKTFNLFLKIINYCLSFYFNLKYNNNNVL